MLTSDCVALGCRAHTPMPSGLRVAVCAGWHQSIVRAYKFRDANICTLYDYMRGINKNALYTHTDTKRTGRLHRTDRAIRRRR